MKIAYLITRSDALGGAQRHVLDCCRAMIARGHAAHVLAGGDGVFLKQLREAGAPCIPLRLLDRPLAPGRDLLAAREIAGHLRTLRPDLISAHSSKAGWLGRWIGRRLGIPTVFTVHGWVFSEGAPAGSRWLGLMAEKWAARWTQRAICVSDYDRALALKHGVLPPERLTMIHNGVLDTPLQAQPEKQPLRVVMTGRLERQKDPLTLIRALSGMADGGLELELVGDGPERTKIEQFVRLHGMAGRVRLMGSRSDVAEILARARIFVLASHWEGLPRSILEAMRAGLPVIASDVGGVREAVEDGITGFLVPRGDVEALRDRLSRLARDPELRSRMGRAGRKRYEDHFTFERMFGRTMAVYEEVLKQ